MKRLYSLKGRSLFYRVYNKGQKIQGRGIRIFILKITDSEKLDIDSKKSNKGKNLKIGISISKKYGNAPARNKAKRRIRSICSEILDEMNDGFFMVINPVYSFKNMEYSQSKESIRYLLRKGGVIKR